MCLLPVHRLRLRKPADQETLTVTTLSLNRSEARMHQKLRPSLEQAPAKLQSHTKAAKSSFEPNAFRGFYFRTLFFELPKKIAQNPPAIFPKNFFGFF